MRAVKLRLRLQSAAEAAEAAEAATAAASNLRAARAARARWWVPVARAVTTELLKLLEASAAWVCGCAVLAAIAELLPTLNQIPTQDASVVLGDLASAIFLNLCALLWLR